MYYWCAYHQGVLIGNFSDGFWRARVSRIVENKPEGEVATRLKAFQPVKGPVDRAVYDTYQGQGLLGYYDSERQAAFDILNAQRLREYPDAPPYDFERGLQLPDGSYCED